MNYRQKQILSFFLISLFAGWQLFLLLNSSPVKAQQGTLIGGQKEFGQIGRIAYGQTGRPDNDIRVTIVRGVNVFLTVLSVIFLVLVVVAGFQYMIAGGNQEKAKEAINRIKNATIGLVIILLSWAISFFVLLRLRAITQGHVEYIEPSPNIFR